MSNETRDLLIEIGTEELPPKALAGLAEDFALRMNSQLNDIHKLYVPDTVPHYYYSPRRIAVLYENISIKQLDVPDKAFGPPVAVAYDAKGNPNEKAEGFARKYGITVNKLKQKDGKLYYEFLRIGKTTAEIIPSVIIEALGKLSIPKRMRWGSGVAEFVRPVHWVVVLLDDKVIECEILGVKSGRSTRGHRYHYPEPIEIKSASNYVDLLRSAKVWLDGTKSKLKEEISTSADKLAAEVNGIPLNNDFFGPFVAEIAALVEWPVSIRGSFDPKFLELPEEILIATLEGQQRYFPIRDKKTGKLLPHFITIANIESKDPQQVRHGNERVIVPRLTDAMFFWETDKAATLESRIPALDGIIFQKKLGSIGEKIRRVSMLAAKIAGNIGGNPAMAKRAAELAKCDLVTTLVGEFPELQGSIGRYLAQHDGEAAEVADAIEEHYLPRFAGDRLPETRTGQALAIADKLDTLVGIFAIGQAPTGDKDPFALRRASLGVLRIMVESSLNLDLKELLKATTASFDSQVKADDVVTDVFDFMMERLRSYLRDRNYAPDEIDAVLSLNPTQLDHVVPRLDAIKMFRALPEGMALAAANKRIQNILRQAGNGDIYAITPANDGSLLVDDAEKVLSKKLDEIAKKIRPLTAAGNYATALKELAKLRDTVDTFFDKVMVMADDGMLRTARLQLLAAIHHEFQAIADVSKLQG